MPLSLSERNRRHQLRQRKDKRAAAVITMGGWFVLITLTALIWHLISSVFPLLLDPALELQEQRMAPLPGRLENAGPYGAGQVWVFRSPDLCTLSLYDPELDKTLHRIPNTCDTQVAFSRQQLYLIDHTENGIIRVEQLLRLRASFERQQLFSFAYEGKVNNADFSMNLYQSDSFWLVLGHHQGHKLTYWLDKDNPSRFTSVLVNSDKLLPLPNSRQLVSIEQQKLTFRSMQNEVLGQVSLPEEPLALYPTASQRGFYLSFADGRLQKWNSVNRSGALTFEPAFSVQLPGQTTRVFAQAKYNAAMALTSNGELVVFNSTHGRIASILNLAEGVLDIFPRQEALMALYPSRIDVWHWRNMSSVTDHVSLWHPIGYEGYEQAEYVWQSTPGADGVEAKYSLVPLVIGSFKAATYAMFIAVPLALSIAVYSGFFVAKPVRNALKPSIELIEAIPSVLIGFLAAIWLVPLAEQTLMAVVLAIVLLLPGAALMAFWHKWASRRLSFGWRQGTELAIALPILVLMAQVIEQASPMLLEWWREAEVLHLPASSLSTQGGKNTLVVALALGFAIIPTIYSIAEDAIHEVPQDLRNASLALGATQLQTLRNVVMVAALPGVFAAVVLGFGRALGETMILLMVTGNTPVTDWDLFSGLRSVAANLAIELPEAELGSLHYQVLMLSALLLFVFTFVFNTMAELIRGRLRRRVEHA